MYMYNIYCTNVYFVVLLSTYGACIQVCSLPCPQLINIAKMYMYSIVVLHTDYVISLKVVHLYGIAHRLRKQLKVVHVQYCTQAT